MKITMPIIIRVHFDGKVIVPDEPADLPVGQPLEAEFRMAAGSDIEQQKARRSRAWQDFAANPISGLSLSDDGVWNR